MRRLLAVHPHLRVAATWASFGLMIFGSVWITARFSALFGTFLWVQRASDEPFYFWQLYLQFSNGVLDVNYRFFGKLLAAALLSLGASFDAMVTTYGIVNPLLVLAGAVVLAANWERRSVGRLVWALLLVFSFDFLSGSSRVMDYNPPAVWLAGLIDRPALLAPDVTSYFVVQRRPDPQSSWIVFFPYLAALLGSFLRDSRRLYVGVCIATPFLTVLYINVAVVALLVFVQISLYAIVLLGRRITWPFVLAVSATLLAAAAIYLTGSTAAIVSQAVIHTHAPILRPSIGLALLGLAWAGWSIARQGRRPGQIAAVILFGVPLVTLNQQILTGLAVMPQNWEFNANYICLVAGAGLMSGNVLSSLEAKPDIRQFVPIALWAAVAFYVVQGEMRNEAYWSVENVQSVLYKELLAAAGTKAGHIDAVILPRFFDESLFVTRAPKGTLVLGGYDQAITQPNPVWRDEQSFEEHAAETKASFATGFETLFRSGVTPEQLRANMEAEIMTGDCWKGLSYFFSLNDCWPAFVNYQSPGTKRLSSAVSPIVGMYQRYLERDAARDLAGRNVLLMRTQPLADGSQGLIDNELVASRDVDVRGVSVHAYAYIQRPKPAR